MVADSKLMVTKRDGTKEPLNLDKIHKVVSAACANLASASEVEMASNLSFYEGIKTEDIQETLIKAASTLITEENPNYQWVAGNLVNYQIRKQVFDNQFPSLLEQVRRVVKLGLYKQDLESLYNEEEWNKLDKMIHQDRDYLFPYAAMEQWRRKYLIKNRVTGKIEETPQFAFILASAILFSNYPKETRLKYVKRFYNALSECQFTLPTPIIAGVRSILNQYSSCMLIESDDSIDSIFATSAAIGKYISNRAGIGINGGKIRPVGAKIRNGDAFSTGAIPFFRVFESAVRSASQGSIRSGNATTYVAFFHYEIEDILVLKNNKGTEDTRLRHMDYAIQFNKLFYERVLSGGNITLFNPHEVPDLYDAFFNDQDKFKELYEKYENARKIMKKTVKAMDFFQKFIQERKSTGRIYLMNVDHSNTHSSFNEDTTPIHQSNLCTEITLPTKPLKTFDDPDAEIALCILGAVNLGKIDKPDDFKEPCELMVRALDELIDIQGYPMDAAKRSATQRRSLGIGLSNLAYWLAKNGFNYQNPSQEELDKLDELFEAFSYWSIKASADLAVEKGACAKNDETKYSRGIVPVDTAKKEARALSHRKKFLYDWDALRQQLKTTGIRNSTLLAQMPVENSAIVSNSTNGIEAPRAIVSYKQSKHGVVPQVVPGPKRLWGSYDFIWDQKTPEGYMKIVALLQSWIDQAVSMNVSYDPKNFPDKQVPMSQFMLDIFNAYKYGLKTLYYSYVNDHAGEDVVDKEQEKCESCTL